MKKTKAWLCVSCVLTVCFTAFIFYNAMQMPYESNLRSESIVQKLQSFVPADSQTFEESETPVSVTDNTVEENPDNATQNENLPEETPPDETKVTLTFEEKLNKIVRKAAHAIEYALLGAAVCGVFLCIYAKKGRIYITIPILYVIGVALADEYLQTFYLRSGSVKDVLLDFVAGMVAFFIVFAIVKLTKYRKISKENA